METEFKNSVLWWGKNYILRKPNGDRYTVRYYKNAWHVDHFDCNAVMSCRAWYLQEPDDMLMWEVPTFDSFIKAVRWVKEHKALLV